MHQPSKKLLYMHSNLLLDSEAQVMLLKCKAGHIIFLLNLPSCFHLGLSRPSLVSPDEGKDRGTGWAGHSVVGMARQGGPGLGVKSGSAGWLRIVTASL